MKRIIFVFCVLFSTNLSYSQDIVLEIGEWPPYTTNSKNGLATELVIAACNSVGLKYIISNVPWLRAEKNVEAGLAFATFPYTITEERKSKYLFSDPIFKSTNLIIYNNQNMKININSINSINAFKYYKVGTTTGSESIIKPLRNIGAEVETTETIDLSMKKLQSGRIDFIIEDSLVIKDLLKRYQDQRIVLINRKIIDLDREYCIMVTKTSTNSLDYLERLNKGIKLIHNSGE